MTIGLADGKILQEVLGLQGPASFFQLSHWRYEKLEVKTEKEKIENVKVRLGLTMARNPLYFGLLRRRTMPSGLMDFLRKMKKDRLKFTTKSAENHSGL